MPVSYLIFARPEWIAWAERALTLRETANATSPAPPIPTPWQERFTARSRIAALAILALTFVPAFGAQVATSMGMRVPNPLNKWLALFSLEQNWKMFAPEPPRFEIRWAVPGVLTDGSSIDVGKAVAPGLAGPTGFVYTRWHKLGNNLVGQPEGLLRGVGAYLCRRYNGDVPGAKLERFELNLVVQSVDMSEPRTETTFLRQRCVAPALEP
jgi:hypothetical protein